MRSKRSCICKQREASGATASPGWHLPIASSMMSCSRWRASAARRLARAASWRCRRRCLLAASHCCLARSSRVFSLCRTPERRHPLERSPGTLALQRCTWTRPESKGGCHTLCTFGNILQEI